MTITALKKPDQAHFPNLIDNQKVLYNVGIIIEDNDFRERVKENLLATQVANYPVSIVHEDEDPIVTIRSVDEEWAKNKRVGESSSMLQAYSNLILVHRDFKNVKKPGMYLQRAMKLGASSCISLEYSKNDLIKSIKSIINGGVPILYQAIDELKASRGKESVHKLLCSFLGGVSLENPLTDRDCKMLIMSREGKKTIEIAKELSLETQTVKNRFSVVYKVLNVTGRTHAVMVALKNGWI